MIFQNSTQKCNFRHVFFLILIAVTGVAGAQDSQTFSLQSPDGEIKITVSAGKDLRWAVTKNSQQVLEPSVIAMELENNGMLGMNSEVVNASKEEVRGSIDAINYKKDKIKDDFNELNLEFQKDFGLIFRAYDSGVAYRFYTQKDDEI